MLIDAMIIRNYDNDDLYPEIGTIGMVSHKIKHTQLVAAFYYRDELHIKKCKVVYWSELAVLDSYGNWHSPEIDDSFEKFRKHKKQKS